MALKVYRGTRQVGLLDMQANEPFYGFTYDSAYLSSSEALPLSLSLPLADCRYSGEQALPYFEGLLPEGDARAAIARRLGISCTSSARLLAALGRDCAGDISVVDEDEVFELHSQTYVPLAGGIFSIADNPYEETGRLQEETRLSLAGGQEKIALYHKEGEPIHEGWFIPILGSPSTHIIKPGLLEDRYPQLSLNEFLCLRAASACDIPTAMAYLLNPEKPLLVIERYDRLRSTKTQNGLKMVNRIHQEDFCQACGVRSDMKYERDGGPGFKRMRNVLSQYSQQPLEDIKLLVKRGLFNYLIGNCDAHAKNFSLLQNSNGTVSLAPAYDLICTTIYDGRYGAKLSRSMGMKIGLHENIDKVQAADFMQFSQDIHLRIEQIEQLVEELGHRLQTAFTTSAIEAETLGFCAASEIASRILEDSTKRAEVLFGKH